MMFVPHRKHAYRPPWPVTGIALLCFKIQKADAGVNATDLYQQGFHLGSRSQHWPAGAVFLSRNIILNFAKAAFLSYPFPFIFRRIASKVWMYRSICQHQTHNLKKHATFRLQHSEETNNLHTGNCKMWGFHGGDYEELCLLGCYAVWLL
jgi:hypothetical protein